MGNDVSTAVGIDQWRSVVKDQNDTVKDLMTRIEDMASKHQVPYSSSDHRRVGEGIGVSFEGSDAAVERGVAEEIGGGGGIGGSSLVRLHQDQSHSHPRGWGGDQV